MHIFIAGVMQGARLDDQIDEQNYRLAIVRSIEENIPEAQVTDPWALNPHSVRYDEDRARETFLTMTTRAGEADILIAYLPIVSMGTAMEMWEAFRSGTYIIAVTPHIHHWAIRFTANEILPDLDTLFGMIENGHLTDVIQRRAVIDSPLDAD
jgi:hypothetical protein